MLHFFLTGLIVKETMTHALLNNVTRGLIPILILAVTVSQSWYIIRLIFMNYSLFKTYLSFGPGGCEAA